MIVKIIQYGSLGFIYKLVNSKNLKFKPKRNATYVMCREELEEFDEPFINTPEEEVKETISQFVKMI